jgi:hypothetical protein
MGMKRFEKGIGERFNSPESILWKLDIDKEME